MLYEVITGSMNDLSPEIFIDNEFNTSNIGVGLSYSRKNFFGDARKLTLSTKFKVNDIQNFNFFSKTNGDTTIQTHRITSYNVCYTKLLRTCYSR